MNTHPFIFPTAMLILANVSFAESKTKDPSFRVSCEVGIANDAGTKVIKGQSEAFSAVSGRPVGSKSRVNLKFGEFILTAEVDEIGDKSSTDLPIAPPTHPEFHVKLIKGNPRDPVFNATSSGFRWEELNRPYSLSGSKYFSYKYEGVEYTRWDLLCSLIRI